MITGRSVMEFDGIVFMLNTFAVSLRIRMGIRSRMQGIVGEISDI